MIKGDTRSLDYGGIVSIISRGLRGHLVPQADEAPGRIYNVDPLKNSWKSPSSSTGYHIMRSTFWTLPEIWVSGAVMVRSFLEAVRIGEF